MADLPPVLIDGVVALRPHRVDDVADMVIMASDPEFVRWTSVPAPFTPQHALDRLDEARTRWADGSTVHWAIEADDAGTPRFAGNLIIRLTPRPNLGFGLAPWARGRGLMSRAIRLAAGWAFDEHGHPVLHWTAFAGNLASWRVAHACGFTFHAELPLSEDDRGTLADVWTASLRPGDPMAPRTTWWPVPDLIGEGVRLRPFVDADVPRIVEACSDERSRTFNVRRPHPYTEDDAKAFLRQTRLQPALGTSVKWAVADPHDDRLLAHVSVFGLDSPLVDTGGEIGYWAHPDARGRGVVSAAVALVVAHAFTPTAAGGLGRHRLQIGAAWSNTASRHVAERAGFTLVSRTRLDGLIGHGPDQRLDDGANYELLSSHPG